MRTATLLCTTPPPPPLHSLSLSLSPPLLLPLLTRNKTNGGGCGGVRAVVVLICRCCWDHEPASFLLFSQFKFGERGYRLAGGVVLNRKKHLWGFDFEDG